MKTSEKIWDIATSEKIEALVCNPEGDVCFGSGGPEGDNAIMTEAIAEVKFMENRIEELEKRVAELESCICETCHDPACEDSRVTYYVEKYTKAERRVEELKESLKSIRQYALACRSTAESDQYTYDVISVMVDKALKEKE